MHRLNDRQRDRRHAVEKLQQPIAGERRKPVFRPTPTRLHYQRLPHTAVQHTVDEGVGNKGSA